MAAAKDIPGSFDYIVVGAGTAGCVLANRLSADPSARVLLLEAGGRDNYLWIHIPVGYLYTQNNPRTDWCFKTEAEPGLNGRALNYPRGRVLGGCSSINGMIYMRGQARDYDHWRQLGNAGWAWDDVLPYFKRSEDFAHGADDVHGSGGEWRVEEMRLSWEILDAFREAAAEVGIPEDQGFQPRQQRRLRLFPGEPETRRALDHGKAFLRPALKRPNLAVLTHAQVKALQLEGRQRRRRGVLAGRRDVVPHARRREVILAAGADRLAAALAALRHRPGASSCASTASRCVTSCPASARTCRTICRSALIYKVEDARDAERAWPTVCSAAPAWRCNTRCCGAGR